MPTYYIDALDPAGASAFVSLREGGLLWPKPEAAEPAWYLSAPDFTPTPVGSRAIGFAATVRGLQIGLSLDGETEVTFMTLDSVVAFVRRLYLAGGGPGGDTDGPTPPPPPEGWEPPDVPPPPRTLPGEGVLAAVEIRAQALVDHSKTLDFREGRTAGLVSTQIPFTLADSKFRAEGEAALEHALELIGAALSERTPAAEDTTRVQWLRSLQTLRQLGSLLGRENTVPQARVRAILRSLGTRPFFPSDRSPVDPLDLLARMPLPNEVAQGEHWHSVADLFFGCIAAPSKLLAPVSGIERCCLLYFAAYILASGGRMSVRGLEQIDRSVLLVAEMRRAAVWLLDQMPDHAFAPEIEEIFSGQRRVI